MSAQLDRDQVAALVRTVLDASAPLGLEDARRLALLAEGEARAAGIAISFAAVDAAGGLVLLHRMDGALPVSVELAANKAYTAAVFRMSTHELGVLAQPGQPLYGVQSAGQGRVVVFGGGLPLQWNGVSAGAIGISGGSVEQDARIAAGALSKFQTVKGHGPNGGSDHG